MSDQVCTCGWTCTNEGMPAGPCRVHVEPEVDVEAEWAQVPARNPFYKGATPADVARALLGKPPTGLKSRV